MKSWKLKTHLHVLFSYFMLSFTNLSRPTREKIRSSSKRIRESDRSQVSSVTMREINKRAIKTELPSFQDWEQSNAATWYNCIFKKKGLKWIWHFQRIGPAGEADPSLLRWDSIRKLRWEDPGCVVLCDLLRATDSGRNTDQGKIWQTASTGEGNPY